MNNKPFNKKLNKQLNNMVIKILKTGVKLIALTVVAIGAQVVAGKAGKGIAKTINDILD